MRKYTPTTYRTAYFSKWKSPCILEHLLTDNRKAKQIIQVLQRLNLVIKPYTNSNWFDIVEK